MAAEGLRVRFSRVRGDTHKDVLQAPFYLPAALGDFEVSEQASFTDYETISAGEFSQPAGGKSISARKLREIDIEAITVEWDADWIVTENSMEPEEIFQELRDILRLRTPFELLATLRFGFSKPELQMKATLRSLTRTLKHGQTENRYYQLGIKEWRDAEVRRKSSKASRAKGVDLPTSHKLDENDSLISLSKKYYGTHNGWREIAQENGIRGWGARTALVKSKRFRKGSKVRIPIYSRTHVWPFVPEAGERTAI